MPGPRLGEITSIRGDADIANGSAGGGGSSAVIPFNEGINYLNQASQARGAYNRYLSEQYQNNISNFLTNIRNIDMSKVLPTDLPVLRQKYAELAADIADNYDVIRNPNVNPQKFAEFTQKETDLRGLIAQSSGENSINTYNRQMITSNPTYNTKENQERIQRFIDTPLGERKDYLLNTPTNFDVVKIANAAAPYAERQIKTQELSKDKDWINTTEGKEYALDAYKKAGMSILKNTVVNGEKLYDTYMKDYNMLPDNLKANTSPDEYFDGIMETLLPQTTLSKTFTANPYGIQAQSQAFQASENQKSRNFQADQNRINRELQLKMLKKGELDPVVAGEAKMRTLASAFTSGALSDDAGQKLYGDNSKITKTVKVRGVGENGQPVFEDNKIPANLIQFTGSSIDGNGNLHIQRKNNATNQPLPDLVRTYDQAFADFDRLFGDSYAPQIGGAASRFNQTNFNKPTPTLEELQDYFKVPKAVLSPNNSAAPGAMVIPGMENSQDGLPPVNAPGKAAPVNKMSDEAFQKLLKKNGLIK